MRTQTNDWNDNEFYTPYTTEEWANHHQDRIIKSAWKITHAHNYELIDLATAWKLFITGKGPKPAIDLHKMIRPSHNNDNNACARLLKIADYYAQFEHGATPIIPIIRYASRSSATLIATLEDLYYTRHLEKADAYLKDIYALVYYQGLPQMTKTEFGQRLRDYVEKFIDCCRNHASELGEYLFPFKKGLKPSVPPTKDDIEEIKVITSNINEEVKEHHQDTLKGNQILSRLDHRARKSRGICRKDENIRQDEVYKLWLEACNFLKNKLETVNYDNAFKIFRAKFSKYHILSVDDLKKTLKHRSNRISASNRRKK